MNAKRPWMLSTVDRARTGRRPAATAVELDLSQPISVSGAAEGRLVCSIPAMPLGPGQVFAGYTIVRLLGSGGMGEVYLAQHPRLPRRDALKILPANVSADS